MKSQIAAAVAVIVYASVKLACKVLVVYAAFLIVFSDARASDVKIHCTTGERTICHVKVPHTDTQLRAYEEVVALVAQLRRGDVVKVYPAHSKYVVTTVISE